MTVFAVFVIATAVMWFVSPIGLILVACIYEGYRIPLRPPMQFAAFFPGDFFLGIGAGGLFAAAWHVSLRHTVPLWMMSTIMVLSVCAGFGMGYWMHRNECKAAYAGEPGAYRAEAMWTLSKLYHNLVVFTVIGSVVVGSVLYMVCSISVTDASIHSVWQEARPLLVAFIASFVLWGLCFVYDARVPLRYAEGEERNAFLRRRADACHPAPVLNHTSHESHLFEESLTCNSEQ